MLPVIISPFLDAYSEPSRTYKMKGFGENRKRLKAFQKRWLKQKVKNLLVLQFATEFLTARNMSNDSGQQLSYEFN